jgi:clan AA aspartic protease
MIQAYFDDSGNPKVKIAVSGNRMQVEIEALIDTGFDGEITLPSAIGVRLGLELTGIEDFELADGSISESFVFSGQVTLGERSQEVDIVLADISEALIGTSLLSNYQLTIDFVNRTVEIKEVQPE